MRPRLALVGLISYPPRPPQSFSLLLEHFGSPRSFPLAFLPCPLCGQGHGEEREGWPPSLFSTLEMQSLREAAQNEVTSPHHEGCASLLRPETQLRLAFIYFNLVDRHQT